MSQPARTFRLSEETGAGVVCDETGLYLADTPLLERAEGLGWRPRPPEALNADVGARYGLPVDITAKRAGLAAVAGALNRGELALARIAALHLRLPDPPPLAKGSRSPETLIDLAGQLEASGLLAKLLDWNPDAHPRWPAHSPDSQGGRFAPAGAAGGDGSPQAMATPKPAKKPGKQDAASPLATSLVRKPAKLSPQREALLAELQSKLKDPTNQGVVTFDSRDAALKDMGYYFSADIAKYDDSKNQDERGGWLLQDPQTGLWSYDRSQMQAGLSGEVSLGGNRLVAAAYRAGDAIAVHIHPLADESKPFASEDNIANEGFSQPGSFQGQALKNDADKFSTFSRLNGFPLQAAVVGTNGSIWYADGGLAVTTMAANGSPK